MLSPGYKRVLQIGLLSAGLGFSQEPGALPPPHAASRSGLGSVSLPLDSWIYPAIDRLAGLGYLPDRATNIGSITRAECYAEAEQAGRRDDAPSEIRRLVDDLKTACTD